VRRISRPVFCRVLALATLAACARENAAPTRVVLATTTSVDDTGLLDVLVPMFQQQHPQYTLEYVAVGSGQALELGRRGDADVIIAHSPADEERFMAEGLGIDRRPLMRNTFVLLGPAADPARVRGITDIAEAFRRIAATPAPFVSRGDDSGTHRKERSIWDAARVQPAGEWYLEAGVGMADALRIASERQAYILTDNATWLFARSALQLEPLSSGDDRLVNRYSVIRVQHARNAEGATAFADWLLTPDILRVIGEFRRAEVGQALFIPDTTPPASNR
jgi:tungstate transport system substrate-binding protein